MEPTGTLRFTDRHLTVKQKIISLLQQQNISCEHLHALASSSSTSLQRDNNNGDNSHTSDNNSPPINNGNNRARAGISTTAAAALKCSLVSPALPSWWTAEAAETLQRHQRGT
eukprot:76339-Pleurochrysis_carterae.AAC.9